MRRLLLIMVVVFGFVAVSFAAPVYTGAEGYIVLPRVEVASAGRFGLSLKYTYSSLFTPAINIVPIRFGQGGLEIGWGWDLGGDTTLNPMLVSLKFQFVTKAALGGVLEIPMATDNVRGTIYLAWEEKFQASKIADSYATFLIGYTFGEGGNINFGIGIQKNLFIPQLYLIADFCNFPYRFGGGGTSRSHLNENRGILNVGIRLVVVSWLSFDFVGTDLMDGDRGFMVGGNLYLSLWGGKNK